MKWLPVKAAMLLANGNGTKQRHKFEKGEFLGEGTFGRVFRSGPRHVLKEARQSANSIEVWLRECLINSRLSHSNVVAISDVGPLSLLFEYGGASLHDTLKLDGPFELGLAVDVMRQAFAGTAYLHNEGLLHSDLKPSNILIDKGHVRLCDLGCAVVSLPQYRGCPSSESIAEIGIEYGTLPYRAPEILLGDVGFSFPVDTWALSCTFRELLSKTSLFPALSAIQVIFEIFRKFGSPPAGPEA